MIVYSRKLKITGSSLLFTELDLCQNLHSASALVLTPEDASQVEVIEYVAKFRVPLFLVLETARSSVPASVARLPFVCLMAPLTTSDHSQIQVAASLYDVSILPHFTRTVAEFAQKSRSTFACPGHQGGGYFDFSPLGQRFKKLLGENVFRLDVPHAAPELGDILGHGGPVHQAESLAAEVFNSDETFFVLNGTSTANKIVTSALVAAGDLVLMDRNNHKSVFLGALVLSGGIPVYLDNHRDDFGVLGGYLSGTLDESALRQKIARVDSVKALQPRPFRVAIVQHSTCDGVVLDARALLRKIGHLCDYILFDSAWSGYEIFIHSLKDKSPLTLPLSENDPGVIVTQSVHKQMSGLSQTSQIHKKDHHIRGQSRYCSAQAFNSAFMLHSSTSPSYPLFMSLEVNAAIHANGQGTLIWESAVASASLLRSLVANQCTIIQPYSGGRIAQVESSQEAHYESLYCSAFVPFDKCAIASPFQTIEENFHYLDPCKVIFTTKPLSSNAATLKLAIPASVVTHFLRECNFTPEKADFYNFTVLISPSTNREDLSRMAGSLRYLEHLIAIDAQVIDALPNLANDRPAYRNLSLRQLCNSINELYLTHNIEKLQTRIFSAQCAIESPLSCFHANQHLVRGNYRASPLAEAVGKVTVEGIIPYPPGIMCAAPGERLTQEIISYLLAVEDLTSRHPDFAPHIQGIHTPSTSTAMTVLVAE